MTEFNTTYHYIFGELVESLPFVIMGSISTVFVTVTITTYLLFRELRNTFGLIVINMSVATFFLQLLVLVGGRASFPDNYPSLCITVGIMVHFLSLVSMMWLDIMAVDLYLTISRWSTSSRSPSKLLPRYALVGYGVPALIIGVAVTLNFCQCSGTITVGYGVSFCFMSDPKASVLFYAVPLWTMLIVGSFLFFRSAIIIRRALSVQGTNNDDKKKALRKVQAMGRKCGTFGFSYFAMLILFLWVDSSTPVGTVFIYACTASMSMPGIIQFFVYTCNRRVWNLYKLLWYKWKGIPEETTRNSPSTRLTNTNNIGRQHLEIADESASVSHITNSTETQLNDENSSPIQHTNNAFSDSSHHM